MERERFILGIFGSYAGTGLEELQRAKEAISKATGLKAITSHDAFPIPRDAPNSVKFEASLSTVEKVSALLFLVKTPESLGVSGEELARSLQSAAVEAGLSVAKTKPAALVYEEGAERYISSLLMGIPWAECEPARRGDTREFELKAIRFTFRLYEIWNEKDEIMYNLMSALAKNKILRDLKDMQHAQTSIIKKIWKSIFPWLKIIL